MANTSLGLIQQRFAIAIFSGTIVFALEVEVSYFDVFRRFVRVPWMELLHIAGPFFIILAMRRAVRMSLRVIFGGLMSTRLLRLELSSEERG
jgi:hypothetical protein